jgi:hypothetical protein
MSDKLASLWKKCVSADTGGRNANPEKTSNSVKFAFRPSEVFHKTNFSPKRIFSEDWLDTQFGTSFAPPTPKTAFKSPIAVISPATKLDPSIVLQPQAPQNKEHPLKSLQMWGE